MNHGWTLDSLTLMYYTLKNHVPIENDMEKGIFITWSFWRDKRTTLSEKAILIEINNLSMLELGCVASNTHFAELMGIKKEAVSRLISSLEKKGFIDTKIENGSRNFGRSITLNKLLFDPKQIVISPLTNCLETKGNKTSNKSINIQEWVKSNPNINPEALKKWVDYKGSNYTKQGVTLSVNKLKGYSQEVQMEMVETSIMNNYKGLFAPKQNTYKSKEPEVGSIGWQMQQQQQNTDAVDCEVL